MRSISLLIAATACAACLAAQTLAPTPPMGWNSWDSFGTTVTEAEVKANADYMAAHLARYGWQYIVVDIQWSDPNAKAHGYRPGAELAMDAHGRLMPAPNRFPSAADGRGFKPLADYVHGKGLKFGIHIMRGIPRRAVDANLPIAGSNAHAADVADKQSLCPWNTDMYGVDVQRPGGRDYYDSLARLYGGWGVDFIKADDMFGPQDHSSEIAALSEALKKTGRPIVLSLSPGNRTTGNAAFLAAHAQMWRISDDFWDRWIDLKRQFANFVKWNPWVKPGNWPDGDMLPLGHIGIRAERGEPRMSRLTHDEQRTLMTLWCIARSPLMVGGNLPDNDEFTLGLLTNAEALKVDQTATASRQLYAEGNRIAWSADTPAGKYVALFDIGDAPESVTVPCENCRARDVWNDAPAARSVTLPPHGSVLLKIDPAK